MNGSQQENVDPEVLRKAVKHLVKFSEIKDARCLRQFVCCAFFGIACYIVPLSRCAEDVVTVSYVTLYINDVSSSVMLLVIQLVQVENYKTLWGFIYLSSIWETLSIRICKFRGFARGIAIQCTRHWPTTGKSGIINRISIGDLPGEQSRNL